MTKITLPPPAASLMQSVRGVGYDVRAAIADLIDNSIAADATRVQVAFHWDGRESLVSLLDDGVGMDEKMLETAMTLGSRNPQLGRRADDLGRFGLGLKTASLSQCSRLLVASKKKGSDLTVRIWDLELVSRTDDWVVHDETTAIEDAHVLRLRDQESGTLVLWNQLDRLVGDVDAANTDARLHFQRTAADVEAHLAMVFHRFLEGRPPRLKLYINGASEEQRVRPWDPFCLSHPSTQQLGEVRRTVNGAAVLLQGYVLPHKDRFDSPEEFEAAAGPAGWVAQQGFYVYRNSRLLVAGSWLGLGQPRRWSKDEQHKLSRIQLDLPNALDTEWRIDIKKSKAEPPLILRDWLTRNADRVRNQAREVFVHRGSKASPRVQSEFCPVWFAESGNSPSYRINRSHPVIAGIAGGGGLTKAQMESALRLLETTVPIHRIWLDVAEKPEVPQPTRQQLAGDSIAALAGDLLRRLMAGQSLSKSAALHRIRHIEPFDQFPEILAAMEHE